MTNNGTVHGLIQVLEEQWFCFLFFVSGCQITEGYLYLRIYTDSDFYDFYLLYF